MANTPTTLLVQMADLRWTTDALQAALEHAAPGSTLVLALMLHDEFLAWNGNTPDEYHLSETEQEELAAYRAQAAAHGFMLQFRPFGYHDLAEGLAHAADAVGADAVLATIPASSIPFGQDRELRQLDHLLNAHHHHLYTVEEPAVHSPGWRPAATPVSADDPPLDESPAVPDA